MSKLVENKQLIHIGTEVVVLVGLTFYFSQKNKKLIGHIEDLAQRVEDQEDMLQKHEQIIRKLVETLNNRSPTPTPNPTPTTPHKAYQKPKKVPVPIHHSAPLQAPQRPKSPPIKISFNESPSFEQLASSSSSSEEEDEDEDEEEDEDELDSEIQAELEELVESECEGEQGLKKRQNIIKV